MSFYHRIDIGSVSLDSNIFLAPMAGYTDSVFRGICLRYGASLAFTEMVSGEGLARSSDATFALLRRSESEKHLAVQLFVPDAETAKRSVENLMKYSPDIVDINCGCPVPKVVRTGCGSALLRNPEKIYGIVKTLCEMTGIPVTVKIRTGWDSNEINYLKSAQYAFEGGASAVCMHARTRSQQYMPYADWNTIKDLKEHFSDRVIIGSGDLFTAQDCVSMIETTGCDAVAVARGAIGNPFIFDQIIREAEGKSFSAVSAEERISVIMEQLTEMSAICGEERACREMRKHVCAYLKGVTGGRSAREEISHACNVSQYKQALDLIKVEL